MHGRHKRLPGIRARGRLALAGLVVLAGLSGACGTRVDPPADPNQAGVRDYCPPQVYGAYTGWGASWIDYDNDGRLDLLAVNGTVVMVEGREGDSFPYDPVEVETR